jgi:mannose-6-phosphate isomerase-like protein (cupin superfamily)
MQEPNALIAAAQESHPQSRPSADRRARNIPAGEGEAVWFTNNLMTLKATAQSTGGAYGLVEALAPAGSGPPVHVHHREDEAFWVLEGNLTVLCGEETFTAGPGSYTFLPRDIPHAFVVEGDSPRGFSRSARPGVSSSTSWVPAARLRAPGCRRPAPSMWISSLGSVRTLGWRSWDHRYHWPERGRRKRRRVALAVGGCASWKAAEARCAGTDAWSPCIAPAYLCRTLCQARGPGLWG